MYISEQKRGKGKNIHTEYSYSHNLCGFASVSSDKIKKKKRKPEVILFYVGENRTGQDGRGQPGINSIGKRMQGTKC